MTGGIIEEPDKLTPEELQQLLQQLLQTPNPLISLWGLSDPVFMKEANDE